MIQAARAECQAFNDERRGGLRLKGDAGGSPTHKLQRPRNLLLDDVKSSSHTRSPKSADFAGLTFKDVVRACPPAVGWLLTQSQQPPEHRRCASTSPRVPMKTPTGSGSPRALALQAGKRPVRGSVAVTGSPERPSVMHPTAVRAERAGSLFPTIPGATRAHNRTVSSPVLSVESPSTPPTVSPGGPRKSHITTPTPDRSFMGPRKSAKG
jgi:hypothetical protein